MRQIGGRKVTYAPHDVGDSRCRIHERASDRHEVKLCLVVASLLVVPQLGVQNWGFRTQASSWSP
jgi:hypothetical protein